MSHTEQELQITYLIWQPQSINTLQQSFLISPAGQSNFICKFENCWLDIWNEFDINFTNNCTRLTSLSLNVFLKSLKELAEDYSTNPRRSWKQHMLKCLTMNKRHVIPVLSGDSCAISQFWLGTHAPLNNFSRISVIRYAVHLKHCRQA